MILNTHITRLSRSSRIYGLLASIAIATCLNANASVGKPHRTGDEARVDNWVDTWMLARSGPAGKAVDGPYRANHDMLDTTDAKQGYFSVRFIVVKPKGERAFGFFSGPYIKHWELAEDFTFHAWIKASAQTEPNGWQLALYDTEGRKAKADLAEMNADDQWREVALPLASLQANDDFDFRAVRSVQVEAALPQGARVWFDDVRFERGGEIMGVSDKTVTQYMAEAEATRAARVAQAFASTHPREAFRSDLFRGENLEEANKQILEWLDTQQPGSWSLGLNSTLNYLLFGFSSKGSIRPGALTPETESRLTDFYWRHCEMKNDIANARQSTWWVTGSENHDINFKMANLLSSQFLKGVPEYAERIYLDLGRMQGYGYGRSPEFRMGGIAPVPNLGNGNYKDGKEYNAADHYEAWVTYWKEFFAERARHGFFIEHNASGYMLYTQRFLHDIYAWGADEDLRRQTRMFIDLAWAQWAQDQSLGITGGTVTRGAPGWGRMGRMSEFLMGGPAGMAWFYGLSDYQWPRSVWEMMLGRPAMGEYAYVATKPNEAQDIWPRPPGTEYSMIVRPDSRLVCYTWVTPDYAMGTRMDHPDALYHHLSEVREGITFPTTPDALIQWQFSPDSRQAKHMAVQHRSVALLQAKRSFRMQHPPWFPGFTATPAPVQVTFGKGLDRIDEQDGWVFVQEGKAFTALRVVYPAEDSLQPHPRGISRSMHAPVAFDEDGFGLFKPEPEPYTWREEQRKGGARTLVAKDMHAALVVETSRQSHHATLEDFKKDVLANPLRLKQVIGGFILTYRGCGSESEELELNCSNQKVPRIGGEELSYERPPFDSPWLRAERDGGVVTLTGPISGSETVLDFNKLSPPPGSGAGVLSTEK